MAGRVRMAATEVTESPEPHPCLPRSPSTGLYETIKAKGSWGGGLCVLGDLCGKTLTDGCQSDKPSAASPLGPGGGGAEIPAAPTRNPEGPDKVLSGEYATMSDRYRLSPDIECCSSRLKWAPGCNLGHRLPSL